MKTKVIDPPLEILLSDREISLLESYNDKLKRIGIYLRLGSGPIRQREASCSFTYSCIYSVPVFLVHKESGKLRRSVQQTVHILQVFEIIFFSVHLKVMLCNVCFALRNTLELLLTKCSV